MSKRKIQQMYYVFLHKELEPALHNCYGKQVHLKNNSLCYKDSSNQCKIIFDFIDCV